MKPYIVVLMILLGFAVPAAVLFAGSGTGNQHSQSTTSSLPISLDTLYPPHTPGPVYYREMHNLSQPLSGIVCDLFEGDLENSRKNFHAFRKEYAKISTLVPEWTGMYPTAPVDELGKAMETGDPGKIMPAIDAVGRVCDDCHRKYMPQAYHRYHWDDFSAISVTDPLSGQQVGYKQIMLMLETNMTGIGVDLQEGQPDNARKQLSAFESRFQTMKQTCAACHEQERRYYVNDEVLIMIDDLKQALSRETVEPGAVGGLLQQIGQESCFKCHLVHIPAAYATSRQVGK
jgi:hypothetical protein